MRHLLGLFMLNYLDRLFEVVLIGQKQSFEVHSVTGQSPSFVEAHRIEYPSFHHLIGRYCVNLFFLQLFNRIDNSDRQGNGKSGLNCYRKEIQPMLNHVKSGFIFVHPDNYANLGDDCEAEEEK